MMDDSQINAIVEAVVKELTAARAITSAPPASPSDAASPSGAAPQPASAPKPLASAGTSSSLVIDLPDPTLPEHRYKPRVKNPRDPNALSALIASTTARIGQSWTG